MNAIDRPLRLLVYGASGRMGSAVLRLAHATPGTEIGAAVSGSAPPQRVRAGVPHFSATEHAGPPALGGAVDSSLPDGFGRILQSCVERGATLVTGTTGKST